jgi:hypothetical protein
MQPVEDADRLRTVKRLLPALLLVLVVLASCGTTVRNSTSVHPARPSTGPPSSSGVKRMVLIYSAVIRRLVTRDHTFGNSRTPFKHVYVIDGVVEGAGDVRGDSKKGKPFSSQFREGIKRELDALPRIDFVRDSDVVRSGDEWGKVKDDGVIITLGPILEKDGRVQVGTNLRCSELCGQWLTYVLERHRGEWRVTGTVGPVAIS